MSEPITTTRVERLEEAVAALGEHLFPGCVDCGGENGTHMRWCGKDGSLYPSRRFESLIHRARKDPAA